MRLFFYLLAGMLFCASPLIAEEVEIKHANVHLSANLALAEGKNIADDGIVLMTHGTMAHSGHSVMEQLQELFLENEMNSIAINLGLGIDKRKGMYDCPTKHTHKHTDALDEIGLWVEWLKKEKGAKNIILLGHSRGGNQTAWFAAERDDAAIKHVVLLAPQTWNEKEEAVEYKEKYGTELKPLLEKAQALVQEKKGQEVMKGVNFIYCKETDVTAESFAAYYTPDTRFNTPTLLAKIKKPVLLIAGSEDNVVGDWVKIHEALSTEEKGQSKLVVIDGAGHMFRDLNADEVVSAVSDFVEK